MSATPRSRGRGPVRYVRIALPSEVVPLSFARLLATTRQAGDLPVIVQPERNRELRDIGGIERVARWVRYGALVEVSAASLAGRFGFSTEVHAQELVRQGLCHFVTCEGEDDAEAWRIVEQIVGPIEARRLLVESRDGVKAHGSGPATPAR